MAAGGAALANEAPEPRLTEGASIGVMSVQYECLPRAGLYPEAFGVAEPTVNIGPEVWPRREGLFIRLCPEADAPPEGSEAVRERELVAGQLGLVPRWVKSVSDAKLRSTKLVNTRNETVSTAKPSYDAWKAGQRCIVPMQAFHEDDFRSGKAVPTRIARVDGRPMGVAGLWEQWTGSAGEVIVSYTLLTVNANSHALMHRYQQPGSEKRMLAVLNEGSFDAWLQAKPEKAKEFLRPYPAEKLTANPIESRRKDKG